MAFQTGVFVLIFAIVVMAADDQEKIFKKNVEVMKKCMDDGGVTADNVRAFLNKEQYPESVKCFLKCFLVNNKGLKEDGKFDVEGILAYDGEDKRSSVEQCVGQATKTDVCERAEEYELCFHDEQTEYVHDIVNRILAAL